MISARRARRRGFLPQWPPPLQYLDNLITNNITVNIQVGWGEAGGQSLGDALGEGGPYGIITILLAIESRSSGAVRTRPPTRPPTPTCRQPIRAMAPASSVSLAQEKAWGLVAANGTEVDGVVGYGSSADWNFSTNNTAVAGEYNFLGDALHELTHALGRDSGLNAGSPFAVMDLFQYAAPGTIQTQVGGASYFR